MEEPINWDLLQHAAGGSSRRIPGEPGPDPALGVLADLECLSAEERLTGLAAAVQTALEEHYTTEEVKGAAERFDLQLVVQEDSVRGVQRGSYRGHDTGTSSVHQVRTDPERTGVLPGLKGTMFFESVFTRPPVR
jgi:hypothetical protein